MKNVFGVNITHDKNNETSDGNVFLSSSLPPELEKYLDKCSDIETTNEKRSILPLWVRIIRVVSGFASLVLLAGLAKTLEDVALEQIYSERPNLFYYTAILFLVWLTLFIAGKIKKKRFIGSDEFKQAEHYKETVISNSLEALGVPADAVDMDFLLFIYKVRSGNIKAVYQGPYRYINFEFKVYVKGKDLHIACYRDELTIPLDSITNIKRINKRIDVPYWNKETPYNKGEYKKYKITTNNYGAIFFKPYYALCIEWGGENYELFMPPYELDTLSSMIGIGVDEKSNS